MEPTKLLYYEDAYRIDFSARVLAVEPAGEEYDIVLDRTCFYPEGGGQPSDIGTLGGKTVTHVRKKDGVVYHRMPTAPDTAEVHCLVDWAHRFDYMQQHSGQHIVSGVLYRSLGYNTVSIHFGDDYTSIETDAEDLKENELERLEDETNALICRNIPLETIWTTSDNLEAFSLRRDTSVTGDVRVVRVGDYDEVACGGVHCGRTGEVGLVKITGSEKIRGRTRLLFKLGRRAYEDYRLKSSVTDRLGTLFSAPPEELTARAESVLEENTALKQEAAALRRERALAEADRMLRDTPPDKDGIRRVGTPLSGYDTREVIEMMKHLVREQKVHACLVLNRGEELFWCIGCSGELDFPFNDCRTELLAAVDGKGGGRHPMWQGMGKAPAGTEEFIRLWRGRTSGAA